MHTAAIDAAIVERVAEHLELRESVVSSGQSERIHQDVLRASVTWKEVVRDIRSGAVPEALRQFVEKLQAPDEPLRQAAVFSAAMTRGD